MLKVELGYYYDFKFCDDEQEKAFNFARIAREHITTDDKSAKICIKFEDDEDKQEVES